MVDTNKLKEYVAEFVASKPCFDDYTPKQLKFVEQFYFITSYPFIIMLECLDSIKLWPLEIYIKYVEFTNYCFRFKQIMFRLLLGKTLKQAFEDDKKMMKQIKRQIEWRRKIGNIPAPKR